MQNKEMFEELRYLKDDITCLTIGLITKDKNLIKSSIALIRDRLNQFEKEF